MADFGFLNIHKPDGMTSHDVVAILRKKLNIRKIGHSGTLDPFAEGVLVIAISSATRLIRFLPETKAYEAIVDLSKTTDTDDLTGETLEVFNRNADDLDIETIKASLSKMTGEFEQLPPLYSAIKINGKKLYEMMRAGENLSLHDVQFRKVKVDQITVLDYKYPLLHLEIKCQAGFYVRSLARDLGGHLIKLIRTESNGLKIASSYKLEDISKETFSGYLLEPSSVITIPRLQFNKDDSLGLQQGKFISYNNSSKIASELIQCIGESGEYLGVAAFSNLGSGTLIKPQVII
jgi:tRNA pseudouridine55 synthase